MTTASRRGLAVLIVLLVAGDWLSKLWVLNRFAIGQSRAVAEGWLYVAHQRNPGVSFGMLADLPTPWGTILLSAFKLVAIVLLVRWMATLSSRAERTAVALIIAGAAGNLGDRVVNGSVTDFIFVAFFPFVFNLADAAITVGGMALCLCLALGREEDGPPQAPARI